MTGPTFVTVRHDTIGGSGLRMDARFFQEHFVLSRLRVTRSGYQTLPLAGDEGLARAWIPSRTTLVFAPDSIDAEPYLRAHDALDRMPQFERYVSPSAMPNIDELRLRQWS